MSKVQMVAVIATAVGHCGLAVRQPGEEFQMPSTMFDKRPKKDKDGKPTSEFYDPPSWFKRKSNERENAVRLRTLATAAAQKAESAPGDKAAQKAADVASERADEAEALADKVDAGGNDLV